jgi:hypothetical protein
LHSGLAVIQIVILIWTNRVIDTQKQQISHISNPGRMTKHDIDEFSSVDLIMAV